MNTALDDSDPPEPENTRVYDGIFWTAYLANVSLVMANAMTFRFAEFVAFFGGTEQLAGTIVSVGGIGAITSRLVLGQAIDRYGTRQLWKASSFVFLAGVLQFTLCSGISWALFAGRVAFMTGLAGMFTCSIVHIQNRVPAKRRTEVIASLGSSGFLGMILGSQTGDAIFYSLPANSSFFGYPALQSRFIILFGTCAALGLFYLFLVFCMTRKDLHRRPFETPAAHRLIFKYWPGNIVLVALCMGVNFAVASVFLTRFATSLGLRGVGTFFTAYAITAFIFRVSSRNWSRTIGRHKMAILGLAGQCVGFALIPQVTKEWHFIFPAICNGFGHALLFPVMVSLGTETFPKQYRGTGTTLVLGYTEVGAMLSAPVLGTVIDKINFASMFYLTSSLCFVVAVAYSFTNGKVHDPEMVPEIRPATVTHQSAGTVRQTEATGRQSVAASRQPETCGRAS